MCSLDGSDQEDAVHSEEELEDEVEEEEAPQASFTFQKSAKFDHWFSHGSTSIAQIKKTPKPRKRRAMEALPAMAGDTTLLSKFVKSLKF